MSTTGLYTQLACIWEATARKPGNVHPGHSFSDLQYIDFLHSAAAIAPVFDRAEQQSIGEIVLAAVQATRNLTNTNTNLGIALLLAPLAKVPPAEPIQSGVRRILNDTTIDDSRLVQQAITIAKPGGMDERTEHDVRAAPSLPLREWMRIAQDYDTIALQYVNYFADVFHLGLSALIDGLDNTATLEEAIIATQLAFLSTHGDTLIARKCGADLAREASKRATKIRDADWPHTERSRELLRQFDDWLRADGNRRNPGTTADLVTACLFVALREAIITLPLDRLFSLSEM